MRTLAVAIALLGFCSTLYAAEKTAVENTTIQRHSVNAWEKDIGYTGVTQVGTTLYLSGIPCAGDNMQAAVKQCYQEITRVLQKFNVGTEQIIKENIYTTDIDALAKAIPERKTFFKNGQYPAATWVQVNRLFDPKHLLEIELIVQLK